MKEPSVVPDAVIEGIWHSYGGNSCEYQKILRELKWSGMDGCYYFHIHDMYVGVELDGYCHT